MDSAKQPQAHRKSKSFIKSDTQKQKTKPKYNILFVCDFFYPNLGGVEMHMYQLGQCLMERGHKVVILTNMYFNERAGVRYLTNGMKVYHIPFTPMVSQDSFFNLYFFLCPLRHIVLREKIDIIHGHQATSVMNLEAIFHGKTLGRRVVFTDHSLFGFSDAASIHINKTLKWILTDVDACICVSHTNKENLSLRAAIAPEMIYVIPNAVDTTRFTPNPGLRYPLNKINIVVVSRLHFRKGVDLLVDIIPEIIKKYPECHFIIGGDGPKKAILEEMRDKYNLADRMELLGRIPHNKVRDVLCRGHIFLNTSLTEAFCIAIIEAASCGLLCVSTNVGGIPEVLPPDMIYLAPAKPKPLCQQLERAIANYKNIPASHFHERVKSLYNWRNVAERAELVYDKIQAAEKPSILGRMKSSLSLGPIAGIMHLIVIILDLLMLVFWEWLHPEETIDISQDFNYDEYKANKERFGDHTFRVDHSLVPKRPSGEGVHEKSSRYATTMINSGKRKVSLVSSMSKSDR